ncbi:MAG TPA: PDZ domain-containing protein [Terriglobales bacterium]|nr:PDZ domain-containing protein [Terriglobales bacterium]
MSRATQAIASTIILAAFAWAGEPQVPPTPATPPTPRPAATPQTPATPETPASPHMHMHSSQARTSYLGIDTCDVTPERASQLRLPKSSGVEVSMVDQDAPAGKAGLKEHDVIIAFNGKPVDDSSELKSFIRETTPGKTVTLGIVRDGKPVDVKATLGSHPEFSMHMPPIPPVPPIPHIDVPVVMMLSRHNGLTVEPLTQQLAEAFGSKSGRGVLIRSVEKNSAAESAGFRAGDVIVRVNNQTIDTVNDWNQATRQSGKIAVTVVRDKREQTLNLTISDRRHQNSAIDLGDINVDAGEVNVQIADIGPEVEKAMAEAQKQMQKEFNSPEYRKQIREAQREAQKALRLNQAEIQKQVEQARREAEKAAQEWQKNSEEWRQEWQKQSDEWRKEWQQEWQKEQQEQNQDQD